MSRHSTGFAWIDLLFALAMIAILISIAFPGVKEAAIRRQVNEGLALAELAKQGVQAAWTPKGEIPADNAAAAPRDKVVGSLVKDVNVDAGAISYPTGTTPAERRRASA